MSRATRGAACVGLAMAAITCTSAPRRGAPDAGWTVTGERRDALFGWSVAVAGDVDGDGDQELLVGERFFTHDEVHEGRTVIYPGSPDGPAVTPSWEFRGGRRGALLGACVAGAGDVNGDGFDDVIVGAPGDSEEGPDAGAAFLFLGTSGGLARTPAARLGVGHPYARFGAAVAGAGDVDGDGFDDVIVGAPRFAHGEVEEGAAFLFRGHPEGIHASPDWSAEGDQTGAALGSSVAGAGDVNGDGYDDALVGAPGWENGQVDEGSALVFAGSAQGLLRAPMRRLEPDSGGALFGAAVAAAGDLDGDGFADLLIGAPALYHGERGEGRVFLFRGGVDGPSTDADWMAEGDRENAQFGAAIAVFDLDGDGFPEVAVGAPGCDTGHDGEGCVFVFAGSGGGFPASPEPPRTPGRAGARFGQALAAGPIGAGGAGALVIGAPRFDAGLGHQGRVFLQEAPAGPEGGS